MSATSLKRVTGRRTATACAWGVQNMIESIKDLDAEIREALAFSDSDMNTYFLFEDRGERMVVKERRWLAPSMGGLKLRKLMKDLGAKREEQNARNIWVVEKGQRVEASVSENTNASIRQEEQPQSAQTITIKPSQLIYGKFTPRYERNKTHPNQPKLDEDYVDELVEALGNGEKLPLPLVRPHERNKVAKEPRYEIVDGEYRCKAHEKAGFARIEVVCQELNDKEALLLALKLNQAHGLRVPALREAKQIRRMLDASMTQKDVAKELNKSPSWVNNRLALLKVTGEKFTRVNSGHARKIVTLPEEHREDVAEKVDREGLSVRDTIAVVEAIEEAPEKKREILTSLGRPTVYSCGIPGCREGTYNPERYSGVRLCISHRKLFNGDPSAIEKLLKEKPSAPPRIEKKTYEEELLKPSWPERKELMHPKESKIDWSMFMRCQESDEIKKLGYKVVFQKLYILLVTRSDVTLEKPGLDVPLFFDHVEIHKDPNKDAYLRRLLKKSCARIGIKADPVGLIYRDNTKKSEDELFEKILEEARLRANRVEAHQK